VDVGALARGQYRMVASLGLGSQAVIREGWFEVDPAIGTAPASLTDREYFATESGPELDRSFGPLAVIARPGELTGWPSRGSDGAKRAFLAEFWQGRDPTPATGNERRARFYDGVVHANAFFADTARGLAAWETGRGRVFLREGLAPQVLRRPARGAVPAYEVWRYFDRPGRFYVFAVVEGRGGVELIRSNDPKEADHPRWQQVLTPTGVREVVAFLGRQVLEDGRNTGS
jgi:GWxTD domain-containing protein